MTGTPFFTRFSCLQREFTYSRREIEKGMPESMNV